MKRGLSPKKIIIENGKQIPPEWGDPHPAIRKSTVTTRNPIGQEVFSVFGGTLSASPETDIIIVQESGEEYPINKNIFATTYSRAGENRYRKIAKTHLIQVPIGITAVLKTKEGTLEIQHPDYVVIGIENEVYSNSSDWVRDNLEFV